MNSEYDNHDVWLNSNRAYREHSGMDEYYPDGEEEGDDIDREYERVKETLLRGGRGNERES